MLVEEVAPAKLNLGLRILGKRADGYHNILSIFQTVSLCDELKLTASPVPGLVCNVKDVPAGEENLVLRAEKLFMDSFTISSRLNFNLKKNIPAGAGLGGGSSDAAAALRALRRFYGGGIPDTVLTTCASKLGSDIPFLIKGGTAIVSGRGECLTYVEWPFNFIYVIVYPGFGISTAWAYNTLGKFAEDDRAFEAVTEKLKRGNLETGEFFSALRNDFEPTVFTKYPVLVNIKNRLLEYGAHAALLTGSGSSVFGIFDDECVSLRCVQLLKDDCKSVFTARAIL